jgi:hypothetical protein
MNAARPLALLVATAFALAPFAIWLSLLDENDVTWAMSLLAGAYEVGAAMLAFGAKRWYGKKARLLRVWGFLVLLVGALVTVSFAFALVPLLLLAVPSLWNREQRTRAGGGTGTKGGRERESQPRPAFADLPLRARPRAIPKFRGRARGV